MERDFQVFRYHNFLANFFCCVSFLSNPLCLDLNLSELSSFLECVLNYFLLFCDLSLLRGRGFLFRIACTLAANYIFNDLLSIYLHFNLLISTVEWYEVLFNHSLILLVK